MNAHELDVAIANVTREMNQHRRAMESAELRGFISARDKHYELFDFCCAEYDRLCAEANALAERGAS